MAILNAVLLPTALLAHAYVTGDPNGWRLEGKAQIYGVQEPLEFVTDGQTKFRFSVTGTLPDVNAFDGTDCWILNQSGVAHVDSRQGRDANRIVAWVIDGEWTQPDAPIERRELGVGKCELSCKDGTGFVATLGYDPVTNAAKSLSYWEPDGVTTWTFSAYKQFGSKSFPTRIDFAVGKERYWYVVDAAKLSPTSDDDFKMPEPDPRASSFDRGAMPQIEAKHLLGYWFVHPLVDGKDVGWFFLDTGAGAMVMDPAAAKALRAQQVGKTVAAGVVGIVDTPLDRAKQFTLGGLSIANPTFLEVDLSGIGKIFNLNLGGVCGYDFLSRVALNIDAKASTISVFAPGEAPLPASASWTKFEFAGNLIWLMCRFEGDHEGVFTIDTGSGSAVDFTSAAVEKLDLLKDRKTSTAQVSGAGGAASTKLGPLAWFEIAGTRLTGLTAGFPTTKIGAYASPYQTGNIGAGVLGRFDMVLDYRNQRLALAPYPKGS